MLLSSFSPLSKRNYKIRKVVIDAGHGGKDPGCHGKSAKEAEVALKVALEVGKLVSTIEDVKVIYTRDKNEFIELHDRAGLANKNNADLFISIHCNAGNPNAHGHETYTMGLHTSNGNLEVAKRENDVILKEDNYLEKYDGFDPNSPIAHILFSNFQNAFLENSLQFASKVESNLDNKAGNKSRGVKQAGFLVLWKTTMPAALIEIGYLTNTEEEKFLMNKDNQHNIAQGIFHAFKEYKEQIEKSN
ncbi:MAG: N-acetylmuramoyl-L-alanine amidase [Opitutaceae bacterium]|nr:N-acetylmuramoyl-L-alanine amidase [Cytophagales bacterium]